MPKISELTAVSNVSSDDLLLVVNDPGGAPSTNKITVSNFTNTLTDNIRYANTTVSGVIKVGNDLAVNSTGYMNLSGGQALPSANANEGYLLTYHDADDPVGPRWKKFSGLYEYKFINSGANVYFAEVHDYQILVDPNAFSTDVLIVLPDASADYPAREGKAYIVKNINPGDGYKVIVTTLSGQISQSNYLENPETGAFVVNYSITNKGDSQEWIFDGTTWRHSGSQSGLPKFSGNANTFTEVALKNFSSGENASADIVAYNDLGDIDSGDGPYVDMGINSSTYDNPEYSINGPNDSYLYNIGGDLTVGTANTGTNLIFHAGGTLLENIRLTINSTATAIKNSKVTLDDLSGPYASDSAASSAGIPIKGLYYDSSGNVKVRLT